MRSLPLAPDIRAWVSTSGRKPNPIATALIWMHTGALLPVWDTAVLTGPALGRRVRPLSSDAELTSRRWLDQVADHPGFLDTVARELTLMVRLSRAGLAAAQVLSGH